MDLIEIQGKRKIFGFNKNYGPLMKEISRKSYSDMYGPTVGDQIRLADTDLIIEVERFHQLWRGS